MKANNNIKQEATVNVTNLAKGARGNQTRKQPVIRMPAAGKQQNYTTTTRGNTTLHDGPQTVTYSSSNTMTTATIPIINAPTSLANIAQLSGITLMPIGKSSTKNSQQQQQQTNSFSTTNHHFSGGSGGGNSSSGSRQNKSTSGTYQSQQRISNIQSIQSLAQQLTVTGDLNWNCNDTSDDGIFNVQSTQPRSSQPKPKTTRVNNRKTKSQNNCNVQNSNTSKTTNQIPVIPVTEGVPIFADLAEFQQAQSSSQASYDGGMLPFPSEMDNNSHFDSTSNDDPNNISLIKLMAILNNPALTITAVSNPRQDNGDVESQCLGPVAAINLIDKEQLNSSMPDYNFSNNISTFQNALIKDQVSKNRIPQSAANLQKVQGPIINKQRNEDSGPANTKPEHELSWLSHYNTSSTIGQKESNPLWVDYGYTSSSNYNNDPYLNDKRNDPTVLSTSVRNLMMHQSPSGSKLPTVSVQLLKHIADQTKDNDWTTLNQNQKSILEPECILSVTRNINQLNLGAKRIKREEMVILNEVPKKRVKYVAHTSKDRLCISTRQEELGRKLMRLSPESDLNFSSIEIEATNEREVYVSEQHSILENMTSNENNQRHKSSMPEPDEIFINRSKRVMSKIDTMLERKKRRKFERISGRASPKSANLEQEDAESENEWSDDENMNLDQYGVIKTQLPLEEPVTVEKRKHFITLGLVTRHEKNKLLVEQYEERSKIFSPLAIDTSREVPEDIRRLVETMIKTGGVDVQLRVESNIKRNDLPLIEGLNRNTSRQKMNYMNVLGLEKRSKRTTLYKVKASEVTQTASLPKPSSIDLIKQTMKNNQQTTFERPKVEVSEGLAQKILLPNEQLAAQNVTTKTVSKALPSVKLNYSSCREALRVPDKGEYMKSLGLMTP